jgi:hypothetical protein
MRGNRFSIADGRPGPAQPQPGGGLVVVRCGDLGRLAIGALVWHRASAAGMLTVAYPGRLSEGGSHGRRL